MSRVFISPEGICTFDLAISDPQRKTLLPTRVRELLDEDVTMRFESGLREHLPELYAFIPFPKGTEFHAKHDQAVLARIPGAIESLLVQECIQGDQIAERLKQLKEHGFACQWQGVIVPATNELYVQPMAYNSIDGQLQADELEPLLAAAGLPRRKVICQLPELLLLYTPNNLPTSIAGVYKPERVRYGLSTNVRSARRQLVQTLLDSPFQRFDIPLSDRPPPEKTS